MRGIVGEMEAEVLRWGEKVTEVITEHINIIAEDLVCSAK